MLGFYRLIDGGIGVSMAIKQLVLKREIPAVDLRSSCNKFKYISSIVFANLFWYQLIITPLPCS